MTYVIALVLAAVGGYALYHSIRGGMKVPKPSTFDWSPGHPVQANDLRVPGETLALCLGLGLMGFVLLVLLRVTFGLILILVVLAILWLKLRQGQLLGQAVKVSEQQLPDVHAVACQAAEHLSMPMPDVFVVQNPVINAYALGFWGRKSVVLNSATVEAMTANELCSIIGHEFTHIKCRHTHWLVFTTLKDTVRVPIIADMLGFVLLNWSRKAEYTCDRGGLIANMDLDACITALAKVAVGKALFNKMDLNAFFAQRTNLSADDIARLGELLSTHPYIINRFHALRIFAEAQEWNKPGGDFTTAKLLSRIEK